ncbi:TetR-like C-terminal domain-containing protein [Mycobacterium deserti]|uniref:TetR/AcrR family transcriptional regulator C-terminal ligand-binding domain-containing protein n=1 Tax=Mycobacterium deserti TaxID=2978347 RepID=A0ABT2MEM7_9MYCO|nr:TetR-like C-terminal domain-containing protein [Mycobacterium deserti]MCT7660722.1 TetR/AcrR family transcriptional regulator C-terminal ligand-binding domain-containing protein [Mycobacterium deserti]
MTGAVQAPDGHSPWTPREAELLSATMKIVRERGYDGLTLDAVAATAKASKATIYRRWPTKAELVLTAFTEGCRSTMAAPATGTLRGDLLRIGELVCAQASAIGALTFEASRNQDLRNAVQGLLLDHRNALIGLALDKAMNRGEVPQGSIGETLRDVLPGYLLFRSVISGRAPTRTTLESLIDEVIVPSLTQGD